jgi:hypothetical protein
MGVGSGVGVPEYVPGYAGEGDAATVGTAELAAVAGAEGEDPPPPPVGSSPSIDSTSGAGR